MEKLKAGLNEDGDCSSSSESKNNQLWTIRQFCSAFKWPSESAMRAYVYKAAELGISDAFARVGRRVLVSPNKFFSLIQKANSTSIGNRRSYL